MRVWFLVAAILGCGRLPPPTGKSPSTELAPQTAGKPAHAAFSVVPADLIDDAAIARIRHRVRVRRFDRAAATHGESSEPVIGRASTQEVDRVLPVIGESATAIRVVVEDDDARLALWIDRRDAWQTLLVPMQLGDREGRVAKTAGAWLEPGAPIDVAFGRDQVRHVTLRDPDLVVDGWVPSTVLGNVWIAPPGDPVDLDLSRMSAYNPPKDPRPHMRFGERATIRIAPEATAPIVAVVVGKDVVGFVVSRGAWTEIEVPRAYARVRGFVRSDELTATEDVLHGSGSGSGHGFGMSHARRLIIPAGTCLYDKLDGDVVGVQIKESERYGDRDLDDDHWSRVYVDSPWAVLGFFVHDTGSDPKQPVWESCARH